MDKPKKRKIPRPLQVPLQDLIGPFKGTWARRLFNVRRGLYYSKDLAANDQREYSANKQDVEEALAGDANLIGSLVHDLPDDYPHRGAVHFPVLDLDFEARLIPSATPGHYHLYLNTPVLWEDYKDLLHILAKCRIIEPGYAHASVRDGQSYVRIPTSQELYENIEQHLDEEAR